MITGDIFPIHHTQMRLQKSASSCAGFTLVDTAFGAALVAIFFIALFLINSQCLYYVNCSRELLDASGILQARMEQLRNCHWSQIADSTGSYISGSNILGTAVSGESLLGSVTEVITVDKYPTPTPAPSGSPTPTPPIKITRSPNGTVAVNQQNSSVATGDMAAITISLSWSTAPGARARSVSLSTVWAENTR
jgi:hypothetical protein